MADCNNGPCPEWKVGEWQEVTTSTVIVFYCFCCCFHVTDVTVAIAVVVVLLIRLLLIKNVFKRLNSDVRPVD